MKFKDYNYIKLINNDNDVIYEITFYPFSIGFGSEYDDIELEIKLSDNIMSLDFTKETNDMLDGKGSIYQTPVSLKEKDDMLKMFKNALIDFPYINDEWELIYQK